MFLPKSEADEKDNYLLEIRGDVREGLRPTEEESLESSEGSSDKVFYVVRECKRYEETDDANCRSSSRSVRLVLVNSVLSLGV